MTRPKKKKEKERKERKERKHKNIRMMIMSKAMNEITKQIDQQFLV
jgi:hypothetical protein